MLTNAQIRAEAVKKHLVKPPNQTLKGWRITLAKIRHGRTVGKQIAPVFRSWASMIKRCTDPANNRYHLYGARGISVCEKWFDFIEFLKDMGEPTKPKMSLGRIDNDGNYCPENCRWETPKQQARNTSVNRRFTINGATRCLKEWCEIYQRSYKTVHARLQCGWDFIIALETPIRKGNYK